MDPQLDNLEIELDEDLPMGQEVLIDTEKIDIDELAGLESPGLDDLNKSLSVIAKGETVLLPIPFALLEELLGDSSDLFKFFLKERNRQKTETVVWDVNRLAPDIYIDFMKTDLETRQRLRKNLLRRCRGFFEKTSWLVFLGKVPVSSLPTEDIYVDSRSDTGMALPVVMLNPRILVQMPGHFTFPIRYRDCETISDKTKTLMQQVVGLMKARGQAPGVLEKPVVDLHKQTEAVPSDTVEVIHPPDAMDAELDDEAVDATVVRTVLQHAPAASDAEPGEDSELPDESAVVEQDNSAHITVMGGATKSETPGDKIRQARERADSMVKGTTETSEERANRIDEEAILRRHMDNFGFEMVDPPPAAILDKAPDVPEQEPIVCQSCGTVVDEDADICPNPDCGVVFRAGVYTNTNVKTGLLSGLMTSVSAWLAGLFHPARPEPEPEPDMEASEGDEFLASLEAPASTHPVTEDTEELPDFGPNNENSERSENDDEDRAPASREHSGDARSSGLDA